MAGQTDRVSPELWVAQERLTELRRQQAAIRQRQGVVNESYSHGRFHLPPPSLSSHTTLQAVQEKIASLPPHLGWGSTNLTAVLRTPHPSPPTAPVPPDLETQPAQTSSERPSPTAVFKLYPDLALTMLRQNQTAAGRVWLLLRVLDEQGKGWIDEQGGRQALTGRQSPWRVCGWRQLRNLLRQGDGIFWQRSNGRIWLASLAKAAAALGVERLTQQPVAVPVAVLIQGLGVTRAHLYASFHSSRQQSGNGRPKPISRAALNDLCAVTPKTQRAYERQARVKTQQNLAVGQLATSEKKQEAAWNKGSASFEFVDHNGRQGKPGAAYVAWQLPNSYRGPHPKMARGRQKRINRELTDLFMQGMTGNGQQKVDQRCRLAQRYFRNGRLAAQALRHTAGEIYWYTPQSHGRAAFGRIWHVLAQPE